MFDSPAVRSARPVRWPVLLAALTAAGGLLGAVYSFIMPPTHTAVSRLFVERLGSKDTKDAPTDELVAAQPELIRSPETLRLADGRENFRLLRSFAGVDDPIEHLKKNVKVDVSSSGNLLTVRLSGRHPAELEQVVDAVVGAYVDSRQDKQERRSRDVLNALKEDRRRIEEELTTARQRASETNDSRPTTAASTARLAVLTEALTRAQIESMNLKSDYDRLAESMAPTLTEMNGGDLEKMLSDPRAGGVENPELIRQQIDVLEQRLTDLRRTYLANHPSVVRAEAQLKQVRLNQLAVARANWRSAQQREQMLTSNLDAAERSVDATSATTERVTTAKGDVDRLQKNLDDVQRRTQEALVAFGGALNIDLLRPADATHEDFPAGPRFIPSVFKGGLIGLCLAGLLGLVRQYRRVGSINEVLPRSMKPALSAERAADKLGIPTLAELASVEEVNGMTAIAGLSQLNDRPDFARSMEAVRKSIELSGGVPATLLITSSQVRTGKTVVASSLAMRLAREGRRVLLIDLNSNQPRLNEVFEVDADQGLADLLSGGKASEIIRSTSVEGLDVLPCGRNSRELSKAMNSNRFPEMLALFARAYDHVIFDAPAVKQGAAAEIAASFSDAIVLVESAESVTVPALRSARHSLLSVGGNLIGLITRRGMPGGDSMSSQSHVSRFVE
jgi:capsular exopolysaccharide synthesis family protein